MFNNVVSCTHGKTAFGIGILFVALSCSAAVPKISGTVTDLSGKPIANSTVVIENKATHRSIAVQTDEQGRFAVRHLKGNDYSIFVVADSAQDGFRLQLDRGKGKADHSSAKAEAAETLLPSAAPGEGH